MFFNGRTQAINDRVGFYNHPGFCQVALESAHVNLVPGSAFGAEGYVRLSFATSRDQLKGGLDELERLLTT